MALLKAKAHLAEGRVMLSAQAAKIKAYKAEIEVLIATGDADSERVKNLKKSLKNRWSNYDKFMDITGFAPLAALVRLSPWRGTTMF